MLVENKYQPLVCKRKTTGEVSQNRVPIADTAQVSLSSESMSLKSSLNKSLLKTNSDELAFKGSFFSLHKEVGKYDVNEFLNYMEKPLDGMARKLYDAVINSKHSSNLVKVDGKDVVLSQKRIPTLVVQGATDPFLKFPGDILNGLVELAGNVKPLKGWSERTLERPFFKNIRHRSKIDYEVNALQGLMEFRELSIQDALKAEAKKLGVKVENLSPEVKSKVIAETNKNMEWLIFQRSMKSFDTKVGNYDTKHERALNRLVSGLPPAIFLANDAYNLSRMMDDNPEEASKEKKARFKQETSRILTSGWLTLITMGALSKLINNSKLGIMMMTGTTVLVTEMFSRLKNGKHITRLTPEEARKINEKNNAPEANIKPEKSLSFKSTGEKASKEKQQKPLLSFDTVLKACGILIAGGFAIKGLRKIPRVDAMFESVFKPFQKTYKNLTQISDYKVSQDEINKISDTLIECGFKTRGEQYKAVAIRSRELVVENVVKELEKTSDIKVLDNLISNLKDKDSHSEVVKKNFKSFIDVMRKNGNDAVADSYKYKTVSALRKDADTYIQVLENLKEGLKKSGASNSDLVEKIKQNGLEQIKDEKFLDEIKSALEKAGDKTGKVFKNYKDALDGLVNFGSRDKKYKQLVDFVIAPFKFMWGIVKFPYKMANNVVQLFAKKAPQSSKSMDALNMEAVTKSFDKISAEAKKYRDALAKTTDQAEKAKICKKFEDFVMDNTLKAFNVNSMSNVSNSDLSNLAKTAASIATIWFLMTDNYNMVMLKSNGNDVEGAETKFKERFVQEGSRLFYQTLLIDLFNNTFRKQYNGSLMGMSWITITNTTIGEWLTRKSVGVPVGMHTRDELLKLEEEQNNATGFKKDYYQFMKRLTGKRSIQSYKVKNIKEQVKEAQAQNSIQPQQVNVPFTNNTTFAKLMKG